MNSYLFLRNFEAGQLLEAFLLSSVGSILIIRFYLHLTGYPQIGSGELHIAHMLWGGLLMLISILFLLLFLSKSIKFWAAILGGVGFGTFIDELGKFITRDNNYFFEPTVSIIYVIFILFFIIIQLLTRKIRASKAEYLINTLETIKLGINHSLNSQEQALAKQFLEQCDPADLDVKILEEFLNKLSIQPTKVTFWNKLKTGLEDFYLNLTKQKFFHLLVIIIFIGQLAFSLFHSAVVTDVISDYLNLGGEQVPAADRSFLEFGYVIFSTLSNIFILIGVIRIFSSRLKAFEMFRIAILINVFLVSFFDFYQVQFEALYGFTINVLLLLILNTIIYQEKVMMFSSQKNS